MYLEVEATIIKLLYRCIYHNACALGSTVPLLNPSQHPSLGTPEQCCSPERRNQARGSTVDQ